MSIGSYSELQTSIAGWLKRTNLADRIPDFITLAEASMNRQLRVRQMATTYIRTTDQRIITLPDEFLEAEKVEVDGRTLAYIDRFDVSSADLVNERTDRKQYTLVGNSIWLLTGVAKPSRFVLFYFQRITPLSDDIPQNWLLEDAPDAYLYGSLLQAEPYLKNDARVAIWNQLYGAALQGLQLQNDQSRTQGSALVQRAG